MDDHYHILIKLPEPVGFRRFRQLETSEDKEALYTKFRGLRVENKEIYRFAWCRDHSCQPT